MPSNSVFIQFEFETSDQWMKDGVNQIVERERKGKKSSDGVRVNDRPFVKKLQSKKKGFDQVDLVRIHCYVISDTTLMAIQAIYRAKRSDGTVREYAGEKQYFAEGQFSFKRSSRDSVKLRFERNGCIIKVRNQDGAKASVSPSQKLTVIRS